ncbi:hypothetical protein UlMin_024844 [Ulmus minor]
MCFFSETTNEPSWYYGAVIDCKAKAVGFNPPGEEKFTFFGDKRRSQKMFISAMQARKWIADSSRSVNFGSIFSVTTDGILHYRGRLCIPNDAELKEQLLSEAHATPYSVHPGATKMYQDLKGRFWWSGMKKEVAEYLQPLDIPEWKWDQITMDFVVGLPRTAKGHDAIWVVVDRLTKSAHFMSIKTTFSLEQLAAFTAFHPQTDGQSERTIQILEDMLLIRFGKRGKLNPRYIGPYEILERVGKTAYRLALPPNFASVHNVFHVSMLKKYVSDKSHVLEQEPIEIHEDLSFEEKPMQILDYKI